MYFWPEMMVIMVKHNSFVIFTLLAAGPGDEPMDDEDEDEEGLDPCALEAAQSWGPQR